MMPTTFFVVFICWVCLYSSTHFCASIKIEEETNISTNKNYVSLINNTAVHGTNNAIRTSPALTPRSVTGQLIPNTTKLPNFSAASKIDSSSSSPSSPSSTQFVNSDTPRRPQVAAKEAQRKKNAAKRNSSSSVPSWALPTKSVTEHMTPALKEMQRGLEPFSARTIWNYDHTNMNFDNLMDTLEIINQLRSSGQVNISSACGLVPPKSVVLAMMNAGFAKAIYYQKLGLVEGNAWSNCMEEVYVVLCIDPASVELCREQGVKYCVYQPFPQLIPFSDFAQEAYQYITWLKNTLTYVALHKMETVLMVDVDIVLFKNPFIEAQFGRDEKGKQFLFKYDMMFQRELGRGTGCNGTVNTGLFLVRNTTNIHKFYDCLWEYKRQVVANFTFMELEQRYVQLCKGEMNRAVNLTSCVLNANKFISRAHTGMNRVESSPLREVVAYHAAGGARGYEAKLSRMANVIKAYKTNPKAVIKGEGSKW